MPDIIQLLPDSVANQIAAGEVVQRPASAVKELVENAIDAGANVIRVVVKDAGKTLIQVIDNGKGMSALDARMCFERHATSKIKNSQDLFHIVTKGFRGEALASIAAIAQVELKTRQQNEDLGTMVEIEGSKFKSSEPISCPLGSSFSIKNLFFNVPARRYFLKSDAIELKHIIDEVQRVALTHPEVEFSLHHNGAELFSFVKTNLRQRIVHSLGSRYNEKLVPVAEETDIVRVSGFIGKPDASRKTRGEQFFFVNNRFIKNSYLHHAVMTAYEQILPEGHFPLYLIYLDIDPDMIDINIHPTKTEIKFQDERAIYAILHASIKRALGKNNITPSLDFSLDASIGVSSINTSGDIKIPEIKVNPDYNPFGTGARRDSLAQGWGGERAASSKGWAELLEISKMVQSSEPEQIQASLETELFELEDGSSPLQLHRRYILITEEQGMVLVDQQRAHRRVLFERYLNLMDRGKGSIQRLLFPEIVQLSSSDAALMKEMQQDILSLGFDVTWSSADSIEISGVPAEANITDVQGLMETFLELYKNEAHQQSVGLREKTAWAMASSTSIKYGQMLTAPEMSELLERLSHCRQPQMTPSGKPVYLRIGLEELAQQFK